MRSVNSLLWLARRELAARKSSFAAGAALIALATALSVGIQVVSRARETLVAGQLSRLGPAMHLVPGGRTALDLAGFDLGPGVFTPEDLGKLRGILSVKGARLEERLLLTLPVDGARAPVAGVFSGISGSAQAEIGADFARRTGKAAGDELKIGQERFSVAAVRPETAGPEDGAVFVQAGRLQRLADSAGTNDIAVFLPPEARPAGAAEAVRAGLPAMNVLLAPPGTGAGRDMMLILGRHRRFLYFSTAAIVALLVFLWTYLGASERRVEIAALAAVGGSWGTLLGLQVLRAFLAGALGAAAGAALGILAALWLDAASVLSPAWEPLRLLPTLAGVLAASALGALPSSLLAAAADHAEILQEDA